MPPMSFEHLIKLPVTDFFLANIPPTIVTYFMHDLDAVQESKQVEIIQDA